MKKYLYTILFLFLCFSMGGRADNVISLSSVQGSTGIEVTISVSLTNTDAVSALQLSIPLGDNLSFVADSQKAGSRMGSHTLSAGVKDNVLNIMAYSATMATISGSDGEIFSFKLLLGNNPETISLTPSMTALTGSDGSSLEVSVLGGSVDIRGAKMIIRNNTLDFKRVAINGSSQKSVMVENIGNEPLIVSELNFSSTVFSTATEQPLTINAGSSKWIYVDCRPTTLGDIDEKMTIVSNNTHGNGTIRLTAKPYCVNELRLGGGSGITGEEVTVPVIMNNMDAINGLQMEIRIPNDLEYVDGSFVLSSRKQDHVATATAIDGILSIIAYSSTDKSFTGNDGEIGSFKVRIVGGNNSYLNFNKAKLISVIDGKTADVLSDSYSGIVKVKSPSMYPYGSLVFGRISITEQEIKSSYTIRNRGDAPLIISNITFANGLFSVKEELPIIVEASATKDITVVYEAKEAGDISTDMEIYSNDPQRRLYIVKITGDVYTPDYLAGTVDGKRTGANLDISLNNYSDIYGIQFDINTTKDFTASAENVILTERGKNLSLSINSIGEGKLRVVAYAKNNQFVSGGEGKVMTIKLVPKEVLPEGDYTLTLSNIVLGSKGLKNVYAGTDVTINYGVTGAVLGDANRDGKVGIGDIIAIVNIMAGREDGYDLNAADANQDGSVNRDDINVVLDFMSGK